MIRLRELKGLGQGHTVSLLDYKSRTFCFWDLVSCFVLERGSISSEVTVPIF